MILYSVLVTILMLMFCGLSIYLTGKLQTAHKAIYSLSELQLSEMPMPLVKPPKDKS